MSKFVKGELCEDRFGRQLIFLNYVMGLSCIVYNPNKDIFEVLDSTILRPVDRYYSHSHVIDTTAGINAIREAFDFEIFKLHRKALPIAQKHLEFFKSLEGCTLDLSDSKFKVSCVTLSDRESHNWKELIKFTGLRARDGRITGFQVPLSDLIPNSTLLEKMVEQLQRLQED